MLKYRLTSLFAVTAMVVMVIAAIMVNLFVSVLDVSGDLGARFDDMKAPVLWTMVATMGGVFMLLFGFVIAADLTIHRSRRREQETSEEARQNLEARVRQRTRELENSNQQLVQAQEQLVETDRLAAIGRLAGGVAHDFNNLLTPIIGYAQLSALKLAPDHELRNNLEEIQKDAARAADLTHQLLAFSRRQIIEPKVIDLNHLVIDVGKLLKRLIGENIELVTLTTAAGASVKVDPGQMEQVLVNLAVNARDAMPEGGKLTIDISTLSLNQANAERHQEVSRGSYVMLAVSDTGTGMTEDVRAHIFEPFFTTKEVGKGTGLGLSTCYGIVKQSGGHLKAQSKPGEGTTFKVYLPLVDQADAEEPEAPEPLDLPRGEETVLLAEDEPSVRGLASFMLREQGYKVLEAANGIEALDVAQAHHGSSIDLLFTDVVMPRMGGKELADQLELIHPETRVLYTSGYTDDTIVRQGVLNPGTQFIQKPFTPPHLARKVREVLDR